MKKLLFVLVSLVLISSMVGCGTAAPATPNPVLVALQELQTQVAATPKIVIETAIPPAATATPEVWTATATQVPTDMPTATAVPTATQVPTTQITAASGTTYAGPNIPRIGSLFQTPVQSTKSFNAQSAWLISEPGVINDATTAWTIPDTAENRTANCPEGGFWFASLGGGNITVDGVTFNLPFEKGLNYLVAFRCKLDDGIVDNDLNIDVTLSGFKPAHLIYAFMPSGAYISANWFRDQLVASSTKGFTNCGATGCSRVHVLLFDVATHTYQMFEVLASNLDNWTLIGHN